MKELLDTGRIEKIDFMSNRTLLKRWDYNFIYYKLQLGYYIYNEKNTF